MGTVTVTYTDTQPTVQWPVDILNVSFKLSLASMGKYSKY